ncbi:unnamed protein product [Clonostachys rosea]|uniref:Transcription factor Pcc1 n=1 Tax=Bionectria ochroleuca TaxID=29856 RepID=A0ABY6UUY8_BIOOC|nr:unnamed protein product [Clonostachys rosea]
MAATADPEFPCSMQVCPSPSYINWPRVVASLTASTSHIHCHTPPSLPILYPVRQHQEADEKTINIPFPSERLASTALRTLQVDKELSPLVRRHIFVTSPPDDNDEGRLLTTEYKAATNRMLRVAVNSFMESLKLVLEVMEHLDVDVLEQQKLQKPPS